MLGLLDEAPANFLEMDTNKYTHTFHLLKVKLDSFEPSTEKGASSHYNQVFIMVSRMAERISMSENHAD